MNDWVKGIGIAVVSGLVVSLVGYLSIVKVNQTNLEYIQRELEWLKNNDDLQDKTFSGFQRLNSTLDTIDESLRATKLFVVRAHPDSDDAWRLSSLEKLKKLSLEELELLVSGLSTVTYDNTLPNYTNRVEIELKALAKLYKKEFRPRLATIGPLIIPKDKPDLYGNFKAERGTLISIPVKHTAELSDNTVIKSSSKQFIDLIKSHDFTLRDLAVYAAAAGSSSSKVNASPAAATKAGEN